MLNKGSLFIISGPSGSGKTTLANAVLLDKGLGKRMIKSISFTTRRLRSGEQDKKDYFFVTEAAFKRNLGLKKILEWTRYLGYYYGTSKEFIDKALSGGKNIILCVDLKGVRALKRIYKKSAVTIFISPPSIDELRKRIESRCSKTSRQEIKKRLVLAKKELLKAEGFDYRVVNKDLKKAVRELKAIILTRLNFKKG